MVKIGFDDSHSLCSTDGYEKSFRTFNGIEHSGKLAKTPRMPPRVSRIPISEKDVVALTAPLPVVKWAGGKRWLTVHLSKILPPNWAGHYFEPFVGGGAFFFALQPKKATISDKNPDLITTYRAIANDAGAVIRLLRSYPHEEKFYYQLRDKNPRADHTIAARFLYLNKTCWNGLYRVTRKGKFNTPFGRFDNPTICDEARILSASKLLNKATLLAGDFEACVAKAVKGDFVYFDPPYITGHQNNGFLKYNSQIFSWADQQRLALLAKDLAAKGVHVLISNADQKDVISLYKGLNYRQVSRNSLIGGQNKSRGVVTEALFSNYDISVF